LEERLLSSIRSKFLAIAVIKGGCETQQIAPR
jgi:hypothetical protein